MEIYDNYAILLSLVYIMPIELALMAVCMSLMISVPFYCALNMKLKKLDKHLDLAFKHEDLIEKGLEIILQGKSVK